MFNPDGVDFENGKYISIKEDPNQKNHCDRMLTEVKQIDTELFGILERLISD